MTPFVIGAVQSDFARHLAREGKEIADLVGELVDGVLEDAQIDAADVGTIHVGNAFGQLFTGQGQLGAMPATMRPALWGIPAARHEAACASGSIAIIAAMAELAAGHYDVALVLGVEQERNVSGDDAARFLGAAAWVGHEGDGVRFMWPHMFSKIGDVYAERWGLDHAQPARDRGQGIRECAHERTCPDADVERRGHRGRSQSDRLWPASSLRLRAADRRRRCDRARVAEVCRDLGGQARP